MGNACSNSKSTVNQVEEPQTPGKTYILFYSLKNFEIFYGNF